MCLIDINWRTQIRFISLQKYVMTKWRCKVSMNAMFNFYFCSSFFYSMQKQGKRHIIPSTTHFMIPITGWKLSLIPSFNVIDLWQNSQVAFCSILPTLMSFHSIRVTTAQPSKRELLIWRRFLMPTQIQRPIMWPRVWPVIFLLLYELVKINLTKNFPGWF